MATNFLYGAVAAKMALLTTELNSLATVTLCTIGPEINNSTGYQVGQLTVTLASAAFVTGNAMAVYLVPSSDTAGAAYPVFTSAAAAGLGNYLAGIVNINGSTAAQMETLQNVRIPLGKFKCIVQTISGGAACPTLAASGNTVDLYPTPSQY